MSDTVLEHFLIRDYLRELSAACVTLPAAQARELREQITAHLDEALSAGAAESEVRAELARLGTPRSLAAEAAGPGRRPIARRLLSRLDRVRWWTWVSVAVITVLLGSALAYVLLALNATPLSEASLSGWYYPQDQKFSVETQAGDVTQLTVPERFGQEQGILIGVVNDSDWTQTVLVGPNWSPFTRQPTQIAVGSGKWADEGSSTAGPVRWSLPGSIPPHSYRLLRLVWNSNICYAPGGWAAIHDVMLTVRVGSFTRTEDIQLYDSWALAGDKSSDCH
jgi:hypothetical protein